MDEETIIEIGDENGTSWIAFSPYLVARYMFEVMLVTDNEAPQAGKLHYYLHRNFNLCVKVQLLEEWIKQFVFMH